MPTGVSVRYNIYVCFLPAPATLIRHSHELDPCQWQTTRAWLSCGRQLCHPPPKRQFTGPTRGTPWDGIQNEHTFIFNWDHIYIPPLFRTGFFLAPEAVAVTLARTPHRQAGLSRDLPLAVPSLEGSVTHEGKQNAHLYTIKRGHFLTARQAFYYDNSSLVLIRRNACGIQERRGRLSGTGACNVLAHTNCKHTMQQRVQLEITLKKTKNGQLTGARTAQCHGRDRKKKRNSSRRESSIVAS